MSNLKTTTISNVEMLKALWYNAKDKMYKNEIVGAPFAEIPKRRDTTVPF